MPTPGDSSTEQARPVLGHVNLMVDTLIANAPPNELRAFLRDTLGSTDPSVTGTLLMVARRHLERTNATALPTAGTLFVQSADGGGWEATGELSATLARSRTFYGAGMGLAALAVLTEVVKSAVGLRWEEDSRMEAVLAEVDEDLTQAIQSAKEEIDGGRVPEAVQARMVHDALRQALLEDKKDVESWGGDFPFGRALPSVELWKV
ncbi:hypothetical protein ONZ51_g9587 [Trametes cubensis]|uniref:Uncharacterized protein n=1 Tax=Trametes cubensis TaxID=1111947 RepID=A0AAD7TL49_9APHY|nr:hypothetical protein ONZ51_g9587 [Trametes cubensis]